MGVSDVGQFRHSQARTREGPSMDKKPKGRDSATGQQKQNSINQRSVETKRVALKSVCDKKKELEIE